MASTELKKYQTMELVQELRSREGVQCFLIDPHEDFKIITKKNVSNNSGPVNILIVFD